MQMNDSLETSCRATAVLMHRLANLAEGLEVCIDGLPLGRYDAYASSEILRNVTEAHGLIETIRSVHLPKVEKDSTMIAIVLKRSLQTLERKIRDIGSLMQSIQGAVTVRPKTLPKYVPSYMRTPPEEALA